MTDPLRPYLVMLGAHGIAPHVVNALLRELRASPHHWAVQQSAYAYRGAAVDRARGQAATEFYMQAPGRNVLVMVDDDVKWSVGDLDYIARKAHETQGLVGGFVSKKDVGNGFGTRLHPTATGGPWELYSDTLLELQTHGYNGGAFIAIPRSALTAIIRKTKFPIVVHDGENAAINHGMPLAVSGNWWPFFQPFMMHRPDIGSDRFEYVSEDWAICHYARMAGCKVYAAFRPRTVHGGKAAFTALDGYRPPREQLAKRTAPEEKTDG